MMSSIWEVKDRPGSNAKCKSLHLLLLLLLLLDLDCVFFMKVKTGSVVHVSILDDVTVYQHFPAYGFMCTNIGKVR